MTIKELYDNYVNRFNRADCLEFVKTLPDNCLDAVVTSPPYNMLNHKKYESTFNINKHDKDYHEKKRWEDGRLPFRIDEHNTYDSFCDGLPYSVYCNNQYTLLKECIRALKPDGAIFYNIKLRMYDGVLDRLPTIFREDIPIRQIIRWVKPITISFHLTHWLRASENIYLILKPESTFILKDKETALMMDTWCFLVQQENVTQHPAIFPRKLVSNCLQAFDPVSETSPTGKRLVFDPYMGSGTTAIVAYNKGFDFIGTEISQEYIRKSQIRFENNAKISEDILDSENSQIDQSNYKLLVESKIKDKSLIPEFKKIKL
jgi:modification methylase